MPDRYECPNGHILTASVDFDVRHCPVCGEPTTKQTRLGGRPAQPHLRLVDPDED